MGSARVHARVPSAARPGLAVTAAKQPRLSFFMAALLLRACGCAPEPSASVPITYEDVTEQCPLSTLVDGEFRPPLSKGCASLLGEVVGMDWAGFETEPHVIIRPREEDEILIAAVHTLLVGPPISEAESLTDETPEPLENAFTQGFDGPRTEAFNRVVFSYVARNITGIERREVEWLNMDVNTGVIGVSPVAEAFHNSYSAHGDLGVLAAGLLHEASHRDLGAASLHGPCSDGRRQCDPDYNGAYGVGIFWVGLWADANCDQALCRFEVDIAIDDWCDHIDALDDWGPCIR